MYLKTAASSNSSLVRCTIGAPTASSFPFPVLSSLERGWYILSKESLITSLLESIILANRRKEGLVEHLN